MTARDDVQNAAWQFNEAVSLLREARQYVTDGGLAQEIDEGLPSIMSALRAIAGLAASMENDK